MRGARLVALLLLTASTSFAGEPRATAVELFTHGRALAAAGRCADAVPFFLDTLKIEPSIGALLNLGECREKLGDRGAAYDTFRRAEALAHAQNDDREALARARAEAVSASLPKIAIVAPAGARVTVDDRDAAGTVVVAPGAHVVRATAPGRAPWQDTVRARGAELLTVSVPELRALERPAPRPSPARRFAGAAMTFTGAAGLALASVFGGVAIAKKADAQALAGGPSRADFEAARSSAASFADASTIAFVASAVLAAAGLVVWLTAPRAPVRVGLGALDARF